MTLTPKGREAGEKADASLKSLNAELEDALGEDAADALHDALTAIVTRTAQ